ncbi:peptidoglycan DD-metalloendopeptidase family protein [Idiomarina sp. A28L]|uniref:peptidoglycan DD-metalloendopeptidase family protein n=1 Tax=Idiomarina sp. A28L TaxID=1036674 RepID=UPI001111B010|nr:peptidoglycan DD-metalloendopeptidase family protein [Idiomarina sp. A28L]
MHFSCRIPVFVAFAFLLTLVGCSSPHTPAPVESVYRGSTFHDYQRASLSSDVYTVQRGETLYAIAFRANMDLRDIARLNNLSEPYTIYVGQELRLRAETSRTAVARNNRNNNSATSDTNVITTPVATNSSREYGSTISPTENDTKQPPAVAASVPRQRTVATADIRWRWPSQARVTRRFSTHETGGQGMEFSGRRGDSVIAAAPGRVVYVGTALRGYGQLIILKHNDDYITAYGHNDQLMVAEQQWVEAGQQIATMGSSGRDDVRLRFELRFRGNSVNPENYLPRR